eukprot:s515_g23.t2
MADGGYAQSTSSSFVVHAASHVPRRATLLWVPGATHDSAAVFQGPMTALADSGYTSVALFLEKSRCTSLSNYVGQVEDALQNLEEPVVLLGHSLGGSIVEVLLARKKDAAAKVQGAILLCPVPVMSFCTYICFFLHLLATFFVGVLMVLVSMNVAQLVGGGYFCRGAQRCQSIGFAGNPSIVTITGSPQTFQQYHEGIAKVESINLLLGLLGFSLCPGKSEDRDKAVSLVAGSGDVLTPLWCHESTAAAWSTDIVSLEGQGHFLSDEDWQSTLLPALKQQMERILKLPEEAFKITCRRSGKRFAQLSSQGVAVAAATAIASKQGWRAQVRRPDLEVRILVSDSDILVDLPLLVQSVPSGGGELCSAGMAAPVAWALARSAELKQGDRVLDPMCGKAVILVEAALSWPNCHYIGVDLDASQLSGARSNVRDLACLKP